MKLRVVLAALMALVVAAPMNAAQKKKSKKSHKSSYVQKGKSSKSSGMTDEEIRRYNIRRFDIHNIYVWGGAGYSGLVNKGTSWTDGLNYTGDASSKFVGGGGGLIGVGYEYNYKRFILSVGPEFKIFSSMDKLSVDNPYQVNLANSYNQTKFYSLRDMQETQVVGQITLPVMLGMQLDKWYWKARTPSGWI